MIFYYQIVVWSITSIHSHTIRSAQKTHSIYRNRWNISRLFRMISHLRIVWGVFLLLECINTPYQRHATWDLLPLSPQCECIFNQWIWGYKESRSGTSSCHRKQLWYIHFLESSWWLMVVVFTFTTNKSSGPAKFWLGEWSVIWRFELIHWST